MKLKGLSLIETLVSIAIISLLIGVMVYIILFYNRLQRETGFLTTATLDAKEIGIKIERYMLISKNINIEKRINNGYTYIIKCSGDSNNQESEIWYINNNNEKYNKVFIYDNVQNPSNRIQKELSKEIHMVLNDYQNNSPRVIEVSFYVYNKYAKKYRNIDTRILAYYISIIRWK
ncbi:MAG: type II secretion system protein [bacterium]